jgi:hypothetical protein
MTSCFLWLIAESQRGVGHYDEALVLIDEALAVIEATGQRAFEAEVHRINGELLLYKEFIEYRARRRIVPNCDRNRAPSASQIMTSASENFEGERKTITALFADIKGSMEPIEDLDPEEARAIVDPALKLMMEAVQRNAACRPIYR